ncbi:MAG: hypothetical protein CFE40_09370 [Burkholderiales bacterium PBB1]|nr:MAG: hypothetical protein CFE40_09370 [Burkholderiales bacterium PBB1]
MALAKAFKFGGAGVTGRTGTLRSISLVMAFMAAAFVLGVMCVFIGDATAVKPAFFIGLPLALLIGFAFIISPKTLVLAILLTRAGLDPVFSEAKFAAIGGLGGLVNLAIILLAALLIASDPKRVPRAAWMVWLPFMTIQLIGLGYSPDLLPNVRLFLGQSATMAVFLLAFYLVDDWDSMRRMLKLIVISSFPVAVYTLVCIALGKTSGNLDDVSAASSRYAGPFSHPNLLAFYVVLVMGILLYLWRRKGSTAGWLSRAGIMVYMLVLLVMLFATKTRSAWVSAAALFFLYGLFVERRFLVYLALVGFAAMLVPDVRDRVLALNQGNEVVQYARLNSFAWRKVLWADALNWMGAKQYLFGYGAGGFFFNSPHFFSLSGGHRVGAHSVPVQLLFEVGVIGVSTYLLMFWRTMRFALRIHMADRTLAVVASAIVISYLLISFSDNMLAYLVFNWYFWFAVGAVCSVAIRSTVAVSPAATAVTASPPRFTARRTYGQLR